MSQYTLDATNLLCPLPVIRTQNKIKELATDDILKVTCTDPGTLYDIPTWCRMNGHTIVETAEVDEEIVITVRVGSQGGEEAAG